MANNLRKFANEAEYSSTTLSYPAVSWVVSGDSVHYDLSASTPAVNDKVIIVSNGDGAGEGTFNLFNCYAASSGDITSITIDDIEVNPIACQSSFEYNASQVHTAKYTISGTSVGEWLTGSLGVAEASEPSTVDVLFPSQITQTMVLPSNTANLVIEATIPPSTGLGQSSFPHPVYVPDSALSAYQNDATWGDWGELLKPISEYSGNLPV